MITKTYNTYITKELADGSSRTYNVVKMYKVKGTYNISDDVKAIILRKYADGVPATRIAKDVGITPQRVLRFIKKTTTGPPSDHTNTNDTLTADPQPVSNI